MDNNLEKIIPFSVNSQNEILISAKNLHEFLKVRTAFSLWFLKMTEYGFEENTDYTKVFEKSGTSAGANPVDYLMKIDMAKEVALLQKSEKGKTARKYFIKVESEFKDSQAVLGKLLQLVNNNLQNLSYLEDKKEEENNYNKEENFTTYKISNENLITNFRDTAKIFGIRENLLVNWLLLNNYCYRDKKGNIKPYAKFMEFFTLRDFVTESGHRGTQTMINIQGRETFKNLLLDDEIIVEEANL